MTASNENHDPRSLHTLSNLLTHSGHKRNSKHKVRKGPVAKPGLKESLLHNVHSEPDSTHDSHVGTRLHTPPASHSIVESHDTLMEEARLPISPPPEEEIRIKELSAHGHTSKDPHSRLPMRGPDRSASTPTGNSTTPVRNPRKRARSVTSTRPGSFPKRRPRVGRSTTPEVPYEPPTEQFTPPRDVVMQIPSSAVSSRSRKPKALASTGVKLSVDTNMIKIKTERLTSPFPLPALDLSKPAPPPSPTDDPLLLVGPPKVVRRSATPSTVADKSLVDVSIGVEDVVQDGPHASVCDPNQSTGSHIFYSDDEDAKYGEDEGEYTGCFKFYSVPVEKDPPSSATRARRISWGRPISPFPFSKRSPRLNTNQATDHSVALHDRPRGRLQEFRDNLNGDDSVSDEEDHPTGLVEVSSDNPKAAARAAAILKLHHSYVVDGPVAQGPRSRSHSFRQSFVGFKDGHVDTDCDEECIRRAQRKSMAASGGVMQHRSQPTVPSPLIRLTFNEAGNQPSPTISEHALQDAEREIRAASASSGRSRTLFRHVSPSTESSEKSIITSSCLRHNVEGNTEVSPSQTEANKTWTNGHWRMLDICFTDERLLVGRAMGLDNHLADVDDIAIEAVVERFLAKMEDGVDWDHDKLLRRVTALSARQRAGKGAPPSPKVLVHQNPEIVVRRPRSVIGPIFIPGRNRKDSGGSVKDLVKSFEALHKSTAEEIISSSRLGVRKTASVGNFHGRGFGSHVV